MKTFRFAALFTLLALATPAAAQSPALWSVSDDDTTIYLMGSVHASDGGPTWLTGDIEAAYRASGEVVLETVITDPAAAAATAAKLGAADRPLRASLPKPEATAIETALAKAGANPSALDPFKPWYANMLMSIVALSGSSLNRDMAVEAVLQERAKRDGKRLIGLETPAEQFAAFDSIPVAAQVRQLGRTSANPEALRATTAATVKCWRVGDLRCVEEAVEAEFRGIPEVRDAVLTRRNARWSGWIAERLKRPGTVFVAVGVGHFVGTGNLLEQLGAKGLQPKRVGR